MIIQLPGFLRGCYVRIHRYLREWKEKKKTKNNMIKVEDIEDGQANTKIKPLEVNESEKLDLKAYFT